MEFNLMVPPRDWSYRDMIRLRGSGIEAVCLAWYSLYDYTPIDWAIALDAAQAVGMKVILCIGEEGMYNGPGAAVSLIANVVQHPAVYAINCFDEPAWNVSCGFSRNGVRYTHQMFFNVCAALRAAYPTVPLSCCQAYPSLSNVALMRQYSDAVRGWMGMDYYDLPYENHRKVQSDWALKVGNIRQGCKQFHVLKYDNERGKDWLVQNIKGAVEGGADDVWFYTEPSDGITFNSPAWSALYAAIAESEWRPPFPVAKNLDLAAHNMVAAWSA